MTPSRSPTLGFTDKTHLGIIYPCLSLLLDQLWPIYIYIGRSGPQPLLSINKTKKNKKQERSPPCLLSKNIYSHYYYYPGRRKYLYFPLKHLGDIFQTAYLVITILKKWRIKYFSKLKRNDSSKKWNAKCSFNTHRTCVYTTSCKQVKSTSSGNFIILFFIFFVFLFVFVHSPIIRRWQAVRRE